MHRAFAIDVLACPHCGGRLRLIATLHTPAVIRNVLRTWGSAPQGRRVEAAVHSANDTPPLDRISIYMDGRRGV